MAYTTMKQQPFNYQALLANDPTLQATLAQLNAQGLLGQGQLTGGTQQTLARLGEAPDLASLPENLRAALAQAVTPELQGVVQQSNQAGLSTLAQLQRQYQQQQSATVGNLAARNMLRSGALGQHQNENLHDYTLGQYGARQQALDTLGGLQNTWLDRQQQLAGQAGTATSDALGRVGDQINAGLIAPLQTSSANPYMPTTAPAATPKPPAAKPIAAPYKVSRQRVRLGSGGY